MGAERPSDKKIYTKSGYAPIHEGKKGKTKENWACTASREGLVTPITTPRIARVSRLQLPLRRRDTKNKHARLRNGTGVKQIARGGDATGGATHDRFRKIRQQIRLPKLTRED